MHLKASLDKSVTVILMSLISYCIAIVTWSFLFSYFFSALQSHLSSLLIFIISFYSTLFYSLFPLFLHASSSCVSFLLRLCFYFLSSLPLYSIPVSSVSPLDSPFFFLLHLFIKTPRMHCRGVRKGIRHFPTPRCQPAGHSSA